MPLPGGLLMLPQHRWFWVMILLVAAGAGLVYNFVFVAGASPLAGMIYGLSVGGTALAFDRGLILASPHPPVARGTLRSRG